MPEISEIFGGGKLSYEEFLAKADEAGVQLGDMGELRRAYEAEITSIRAQNALEKELDHAGARNRELVMKLIDSAAVTVDEEGVHGISEQIDKLRESDPYLFSEKNAEKSTVKLRLGMPHKSETVDADSMDDRDFYRRVKKM